jgi:hypothetical protein
MDAAFFALIFAFVPILGMIYSQHGNNLQRYFFFFVEMWNVLVV